jgi:hypothetical protein
MENYITTKEGLRATIEEYGVAIIENILTEEECSSIVSGLWDYFEHITQNWEIPINRDNRASYKEIYKLYPLHSMLFQYFNSGHAQISWDMRQHPSILEIFSHFWEVPRDELLVSFDGFSFNIPPEYTNRGWNLNNTWYHSDQSFLRNEFECIQSWVTGLDVNEGDATLAFMEKSNQFHKEFREWKCNGEKEVSNREKEIFKDNWYKLSHEDEQFYLDKGCQYKKIICKKGSIIFWDSRTIHCGTEAMKRRPNPNFRAVIYICYIPKYLYSERDKKKRRNAFLELRTTNHWGNKLFGKNPRTYGKPLPEITIINPPIITEVGRGLL